MGIAQACRHHSSLPTFTEEEKASGRTNPEYRVVQNWYDTWRNDNFGPRTGDGVLKVGVSQM